MNRSKSDPLYDPKFFRPISAAGMRALDQLTAEKYGMPTLLLMENAGRAVALAVSRILEGKKLPSKGTILIFCGGGNNGGDGLVAARYLSNWGFPVRLVLDRVPTHYQSDVLFQWNTVKSLKIPFQIFHSRKKLIEFKKYRPIMVVDALLGTGFHGPVRQSLVPVIETISHLNCPVVAVDLPSGMDADSGEAAGAVVKADLTVTLGLPKLGLLRSVAKPLIGKLWVADIGLPRPLMKRFLK